MSDTSALAAWIDASQDRAVAFLAELVKAPSDNPPGDCAAHAELTATLLEGFGLSVERHPVPGELAREQGMVSATNLVVRHRFGEGPTLALNAHGDVVPPGEGWSVDPYGAVVQDGRMLGRGVAVSKSDFATYTFALLALRETSTLSAGTIELHFTWDEEAGGEIGPRWLLSTGVSRPQMAICAGFSHAVVTAHNGCLHLEVEVRGRSAHAARPDTGIDALEATTRLLDALYAHRKQLPAKRSKVSGIDTPTLVVGLIEGGINTNVVPDRVVLRLDRRMIPEEQPDQVEAALRSLIETEVAKYPGASARIRRILLAKPLSPLPGAEPIARALARHATRLTGADVPVVGIPLYTDARHYAEAGVPVAIYGAGPRDLVEANAHRADERLELADLRLATEVVAAAAKDLLSKI